MKFVPRYFQTTPLGCLIKLEYVQDKLGNLSYCVTMSNGTKENVHYFFEKLSSAIDFIHFNFQ